MSKRIVFCADGTWDSNSIAYPTNVYLLYKALATAPGQFPLYDDGVGADGTAIDRLAGAAFGAGLFQKIKDGYTAISHLYEAGDQIFIFGFSRGAYTARSLAGMIAVCGLPASPLDPNDSTFADTAFNAYRNSGQRSAILATLSKYNLYDAKMTMVGVWDTVGSLGVPAIIGGVDPLLCGFLDTSLHPDVLNAYQAASIDERRAEFPVTLWTGPFAPGQVVEQVWFAGVHCDVGGGYERPGLADITLDWMVRRAQGLGLTFAPNSLPNPAVGPEYALDSTHDSWDVLWGFPKGRTIDKASTLANSVVVKCQNDKSYRPGNLTLDPAGIPVSGYSIATVVSAPAAATAATSGT